MVMDNFFISIPLFVNLLTRSTYACGTVRANRKYLPEEFKIEQDRGRAISGNLKILSLLSGKTSELYDF